LPWLAAERPDVFNVFQQTQRERLEAVLHSLIGGHVASFISHGPGKALFIGLYSITGSRPMTYREYWQVPQYQYLRDSFGVAGLEENRTCLWIDLNLTELYADWKGKLIVHWP
jgi:hypothetical protein